MKKFINLLKNSAKSTFSQDPYKQTDLDSIYFKKVVTKDIPLTKNPSPQSNFVVEDKIKSLNRTILTGMAKKKIEARVSQLVYENRFNPLKPEIKQLLEIIDYACKNNTPVRVSHLKSILPSFEIDEECILDENSYGEWVNKKTEEEAFTNEEFNIEDEFAMREQEMSKRGKKGFGEWKNTSKRDSDWRKI